MKRRRFIPALAAATVPLALAPGCRIEKVKRQKRPVETLTIAGRTIEELREQCRYDLFDDFLPFVERFVVDRDHGGFMTAVARDGSRVSTDKTLADTAHGLWIYSFLVRNIDRSDKYTEIARKALTFLRRDKPVGDLLWPERFSRDGRAKAKPDPRGLGDLAAANALQEFARATGEGKWRDLAKDTLIKIVRHYDLADYYPQSGQDLLGPKAPPAPGGRVLGMWMRIVEISSAMLADDADPRINEILDRSIRAVVDSHHNPDIDLTNEIMNHDLSRPANEYARLVHTGNAIETFRILMEEAARVKDRALFDNAAGRFRRHVEAAWDAMFGGVYRLCFDAEKNVWDLSKELRVQEEALLGALTVIEHTDENWAKELYGRLYSYIRERFPLRKYGYALWMEYADRRVAFTPRADHVDIFYHPRHLMMSMLAFDRMLARGGGTLPKIFG